MCKILAISDLHGYLPAIPECDLLILAGDYNPGRHRPHQIAWMDTTFAPWLERQPAKEVVWIAGNHDGVLRDPPEGFLELFRGHYLQDSCVELFGFKIWGSPWTPEFGGWPFMDADERLRHKFGLIPNDVDILVTHGPPYGLLDKDAEGICRGSKTLWEAVRRVRPRLHVYGHIHEHRGEAYWEDSKTVFANVSHVRNVGDGTFQVVGEAVDFSDIF